MPLAGKELKNYEALPGVLGNTGSMAFISGEQGNQGQILRETGEQTQYWGTGNIRKHIFDFWGQGNKPIYFRGTREQVPPPGRASTIETTLMLSFPYLAGMTPCDSLQIGQKAMFKPLQKYFSKSNFGRHLRFCW